MDSIRSALSTILRARPSDAAFLCRLWVLAVFGSYGSLLMADIPSSEREALIAIYISTNGGAWGLNANWCTTNPCPPSNPTFNAPGTECFDPAEIGTGWIGVECDDERAHVVAIGLSANHLDGQLPSLAAFTHAQSLAFDSNRLEGPLPDLSGLAALRFFSAEANRFSGALPLLHDLDALEFYSVSQNMLVGNMQSLSGVPTLMFINVSANQLTGAIPNLEDMPQLTGFNADGNRLTGPLPDLAALTALDYFFVSHNELTGPIPLLPNALRQINVSYNRLNGPVPVAPPTLVPAGSDLCPNPLDLAPSGNDEMWNAATGHEPWWADPSANNRCDDLLNSTFD